jgi:hypothetical protein
VTDPTTPEIMIAVCDHGHVLVGEFSLHSRLAFHWRGKNVRTIRRWGTTRGVAELRNGPLQETVLDDLSDVIIPFRAVIYLIEVNQEVWKSYLTNTGSSQSQPTRLRH